MYRFISRLPSSARLPFAAVEAVVTADGALSALELVRAAVHRQATPSDATAAAHTAADAVLAQLIEYGQGRRSRFDLRLQPEGTTFQQRVWSELLRIGYGELVTYADIAAALGSPRATRAVGGANGRNPIPVIIPCHRVVASNGLGGYSGGLDIKRALLRIEGVNPEALPLRRGVAVSTHQAVLPLG